MWAININGLGWGSTKELKIKLEAQKRDPDIIAVCETNGILNINGYRNFHTEAQRKSAGINILIRENIAASLKDQWEGYFLRVKIHDNPMEIIMIHTPRQKQVIGINELTKKYMWNEPMLIMADADRMQEKLNFPVNWKVFDVPTYEKGKIKTSPDVVSSLYLDYVATVGERISDHHMIEIKAKYYKEKSLYSIFPYRKDTKEILKTIRESKTWPREPIKLKKKFDYSRAMYINPELEGKPEWKKRVNLEYEDKVIEAWCEERLHDLHGLILSKIESKKVKLVEYILQEDKVIPLGEATEIFAKWWTSKYYDPEEDVDTTLEFPRISEGEAKAALKLLRTGKALSTDLIADDIFEEGGEIYEDITERLINCLEEGVFIEYVTIGRLMLLSKNRTNTATIDQIRPITILSPIYKIYELHLKRKIQKIIWNSIDLMQYGFRMGKSTQDNIIDVKTWMRSRYATKQPSILVYVDIEKAFDNVRRMILYKKLREKISPEDFALYAHLTINTRLQLGEKIIHYTRGVPQGAILSPMMFAFYINECMVQTYENLRSVDKDVFMRLYADNIIIGGGVDLMNKLKEEVEKWREINMNVRWEKSQYMTYRIRDVDTTAQKVKRLKYLGVTLEWDPDRSVKARLRKWQKAKIWFANKWSMTKTIVCWQDLSQLIYQFYADYYLELISGKEINEAFVKKTRKRTATPNYLSTVKLYNLIGIKVSDILDLNVNAQRLEWSSFKKKKLKAKFRTKFPLSTISWKKAFMEYGFPLLAGISTEINWGRKCACGDTMRKTHYSLNPGYKTWKKWFLGKDILLAMQGMAIMSYKEIITIIEECKQMLNPTPKEHKLDEEGLKNLREKPFKTYLNLLTL